MRVTNAEIMSTLVSINDSLKAIDARVSALESSKATSKPSTKRQTVSKASTKKADTTWNEEAYRKAVKKYGVAGKNGGCYKFCRELFVAYGKGEITDKELASKFKACKKPEWF